MSAIPTTPPMNGPDGEPNRPRPEQGAIGATLLGGRHDGADRGVVGDVDDARTGALQGPDEQRRQRRGDEGKDRARAAKVTRPPSWTGLRPIRSESRPTGYCTKMAAKKKAAITTPTRATGAPSLRR